MPTDAELCFAERVLNEFAYPEIQLLVAPQKMDKFVLVTFTVYFGLSEFNVLKIMSKNFSRYIPHTFSCPGNQRLLRAAICPS